MKDCGRKWNECGNKTENEEEKRCRIGGDREIGMNCLMQGDNPAGILRKEDVRKDIENTEILVQTNEIATGGTSNRVSGLWLLRGERNCVTQREPSNVSWGNSASSPSSLIDLTRVNLYPHNNIL